MNKKVGLIALVVLAGGAAWWLLSRTEPAELAGPPEATGAAAVAKAEGPAPDERRDAQPKPAPPPVDFPMEIPSHLPALKLPAGGTVVVLEEIADVPTRRHVYGRAATGAIGCIGSAGVDSKTLDPEFRARIVIAPTGDRGSQVVDIVMLNADSAPPALVKCLREALARTQLALPTGVRGIVTTPPFSGERPPPKPPGGANAPTP